jgi:hypothetical protein
MPIYAISQAGLSEFLTEFRQRDPSRTSGTHVVRVYEKAHKVDIARPDTASPLVALVLVGPLTEEQMRQATQLMYTVRR